MKHKKLDTLKTSGFEVPKNYFSQVEKDILSEAYLKDKVNVPGFGIPESYFETLESNILSTIEQEYKVKVIPLFNWKNVMYVSAIAACLVLMFNVFYNASETITFDSLETASIENYLEQEDYTSYELASLLTEDELNINNFTDTEISEESLEDYLLDQSNIEDLILQ
ncbi:hypothetical protein ES692_01870 [Psychroserpens burtonensis]|uniref:Uncharacterized protein n=1 Tax=Psychroserpens burtonensis TaxID=49278 RepID=A0A5C7BAV0_9FLAO|nr:hypothetical protein [Psychroserpens burtonensis]TXE20032.1 hypothetical protein ES692_01870 [Psychroserpens burtonensis]